MDPIDPYQLLDIFSDRKADPADLTLLEFAYPGMSQTTRRLVVKVVCDGTVTVQHLYSLSFIALDRIEGLDIPAIARCDAIQLVAALSVIKFPLIAYKIIDTCLDDPDEDVRTTAAIYSSELPLLLFDAILPKLNHLLLIDPCSNVKTHIRESIKSFQEERKIIEFQTQQIEI